MLRSSLFFAIVVIIDSGCSLPLSSTVLSKNDLVLVTGATGRTGSLIYKDLKSAGFSVRALLRNATKAKDILPCGACTEAEGIFVGDVTDRSSLVAAFKGVNRVVIAVGSVPLPDGKGSYYFPKGAYPIDIDYLGCNNQVAAAKEAGVEHILLVSSMGTTQPDGFLDKLGNGWALFYKLNAEAYMMGSGIKYTIVKPSGLTDSAPGKALLLVGHDDDITNQDTMNVTRADVASVLLQAIQDPGDAGNVRFDLSSDVTKPASGDFKALFAQAHKL